MIWDEHSQWEEAEKAWDEEMDRLKACRPLKGLKTMPRMQGIAEQGIKRKGLLYLLFSDRKWIFWRYVFQSPFRYAFRLLSSYLRKEAYVKREGDFFFYGIEKETALFTDPEAIWLLGFSYCHKPFECPSGRFSDQCIHDANHWVCRQCFIGKCVHAAPKKAEIVWIPTIHYIGEKIFSLLELKKPIHFLITACEMSLAMFGDWANMVGIQGIDVRLDGRICNTMQAFFLSEKGVKPGLTVLLPETETKILEILKRAAI